MTEVSFHTQLPDPLGYACRLLRKALHQGAEVVVTAPPETLKRLDQMLWTFDPLEFIAHRLLREGEVVAPRLRRTPIWLTLPGAAAPTHDVLINIDIDPVPGFESYRRVIELVGNDEAQVLAARRRWRHYRERGYTVAHHALG